MAHETKLSPTSAETNPFLGSRKSFGQNENPQKQSKYLWKQWQGLDLSWCSCSFSFWSRSATSCASSFSRWFKVSLASLGSWRHESFKNGRFGGCFFGGTNTTTETYSLMMFFLVGCGSKNKIGSWSLSKSTYMKLKLLDWQWDWDRNWFKKTLQSS